MADAEETRLEIRNARPEELDEVSLLIRDAYQHDKFIPSRAWKTYIEDIMDVRSRLRSSELIVAELRGRLAGAVTLYLSAEQEGWPEGWASIRILAVHPAYRGQGIGRRLMEECIRRCREHGIATVGLHTTKFMSIARKMYEKMGFKRVRKFDFRPASGVVVMAYRFDL